MAEQIIGRPETDVVTLQTNSRPVRRTRRCVCSHGPLLAQAVLAQQLIGPDGRGADERRFGRLVVVDS